MSVLPHPVHRTIVCVDVEGFGDRRRTRPHQVMVRDGLYRCLRTAFLRSGVPWRECYREDRGDGVLVLVPPEVPKNLVTGLPGELAVALHTHNRAHGPPARMRLRLALHAGEIQPDEHGVTSSALNHTFRLLEAGQLKRALAGSDGPLAVIASQWFFEEVIRHDPAAASAPYRRVRVKVKETEAIGWVCLPHGFGPPDEDAALRPGSVLAIPRQLRRAVAGLAGRAAQVKTLNDQSKRAAEAGGAVVSTGHGPAGMASATVAVRRDHQAGLVDVAERAGGPLSSIEAPIGGLALERRAGNLPAEMTRFIGRRGELAQVRDGLAGSRLITLCGAGGVGKTRLALRAAVDGQRAFADGVWLVELSNLREPHLLARTVADTLGLPDQAAGGAVDLLAEYLTDRNLLIVLDTCEHLIDACATLAEVLLRVAPQLSILATSREPLNVIGEHMLLVPPLETPDLDASDGPIPDCDSMTFFADRAAAIVPGFSLTADNRRAVAQLCRGLDGIPLAIELAAVRLRAMSVDQIVTRLDDRFQMLGTARPGQGRHQTLRATVEWSHELCTAQERLLWARLSIFPGDFDLEAAENVCAGGPLSTESLFTTIGGLVDKSIVLYEQDRQRYRMLDTIRDFGARRLDTSGERAELRRRHGDHYLALAERSATGLLSSEQIQWLVRLRQENANLRVALDHSFDTPGWEPVGQRMTMSLRHYWLMLGLFSEGRHWHDRALSATSDNDTGRAWALYGAAILAIQQGDLQATEHWLPQAERLANELRDRDLCAHVTEARGIERFFAGDLDRAGSLLETALADYSELSHRDAFSLACPMRLAAVCCLTGELDRAIQLAEQGLAASQASGEQWSRGFALWIRGGARWMRKDLDRALHDALASLDIKESLGDLHGITMAIDLLTVCEVTRGRFTRAAMLAGAGERLWTILRAPIQQGPHYKEICRHAADTARQALGDDRFHEAHRQGAALSTSQAIDLARDQQDPGRVR